MFQRSDEARPAAGEGVGANAGLQGWIALTPRGGSHSCPAGQGSAMVTWIEGSLPLASAQFAVQPASRPNSPPPPLEIKDLEVGENSIDIPEGSATAQLDWKQGDEPGGGNFAWTMGGLPVDADGSSFVSEVIGPQQGNFHIAFAEEPATRLLRLELVQPPPDPRQVFIRVCVDGSEVGILSDRCQILIKGKVVTLGVDCRADPVAALLVGYTLQSEGPA